MFAKLLPNPINLCSEWPPFGSAGGQNQPAVGESNPAISSAGSQPGRVSHCEPFESVIQVGLDAGLSAQRIYQDLVSEQQFTGSYDSVKRFVRQLGQANPLPFRRLETEPGQEAQVDFGQGAWVVQDGRRRRPHVMRLVLSHSRKGYTEAFWQQTTENFMRGIENAFRHSGGAVASSSHFGGARSLVRLGIASWRGARRQVER